MADCTLQETRSRSTISAIRAEIKSRAFSSNTESRRYRRRVAASARQQRVPDENVTATVTDTEPIPQPSAAAAGECQRLLACNVSL